MHKKTLNELRLAFVIEPRGPILIKSGREAGADPTLLDMNFVRVTHAALGRDTVYLPGSSLKGTLRSYCEKVARTVGDGVKHFPPFSCNPLGNSGNPDREGDYACGRHFDERNVKREIAKVVREKGTTESAEVFRRSCPICRIFGHTSLASHLYLSDAYPFNPDAPDDLEIVEAANITEQRDGVAIDRVSGAVAVGPFSLEVVTKGAFYGDLYLKNFQLWQVGLLAVALRDLARGRVPLGFSKSRGLGRVAVRYRALEISYPGRFQVGDLDRELHGVTAFLDDNAIQAYDYRSEPTLPLPEGAQVVERGEYGRVAVAYDDAAAIESILRACVGQWRDFVQAWRTGEES
jgi:CRISPR/Cas system CSM-associated protein Csm3 (group 7 of RAMP superfamily)